MVPEYIIELLEGLPLSVGFGIKGDVLAIEDTCSLLAGRPVKLSGFVELGSLMLFSGWGLRTVNMPATHAIVCGSVLNKTVSCADERWGVKWDELAESLRVYALGDIKHGWIVWSCVLGRVRLGVQRLCAGVPDGDKVPPHHFQQSTDKRGTT